jgi:hypothetical protein
MRRCAPLSRSALASGALLCAIGASDAPARLLEARAQRTPDALSITFEFDEAVAARWQHDGRELILEPGQALDGAALDALAAALEGWVVEFRFGYDTLLLGLAMSVQVHVESEGTALRVHLRREASPAALPDPDSADDGSATRLARLRAQLRGAQGDALGARAALEGLRRDDPEDVQSMQLLAESEQRLGRWRRAVGLHDRVLELDPSAASVVQTKAALLREHGPFLRLDHELQEVRQGDRQHISRVDARLAAGHRASVELALEQRRVRAPFVQRADGALGPFKGERQRAGVTLRVDTGAAEVALSGFASDAGPGAGAEWSVAGNLGRSTLRAEFARPYWDYVESLVDGGTRSMLEAEHRVTLRDRWQLAGSAALNRYGIDGVSNAADSWRAQAAASYRLHDQAPFLSLGYRLDTEHVLSSRTRTNVDGTAFAPVPVAAREAHSLELFVSHPLTDYVSLDAVAGYIYDRLNSRGPFAELALRYEPLPNLEMGLRLGRSFTAARGGDSALLRAGFYLLLRM